MRTGIIYIAINKISKKSYIGQTIKTLKHRIDNHYRASKTHSFKFANALKKYKKQDWSWEVLYDNIPVKQLDDMEKWCIANYNTYSHGYNSTPGGGNLGEGNPMHNPIARAKNSASKTGIGNPMYGTKRSAEALIATSKANRGENSPYAKLTWNQVNEIREKYTPITYSYKMLAEEYNVSKPTIKDIIAYRTWKLSIYTPT